MFGVVCVVLECVNVLCSCTCHVLQHIYMHMLNVQVRVWITDLIEQGWMDRRMCCVVIDHAVCIVLNNNNNNNVQVIDVDVR